MAFGGDVADEQSGVGGGEGVEDAAFEIRFAGGEAERGGVAPAVAPHVAGGFVGDEGFRRASVVVPVGFVFLADAAEVEREAGSPVGGIVGFGDAGEIRHPEFVGGGSFERDDAVDAEIGGFLDELVAAAEGEIAQFDGVAGLGGEVFGFPGIEDDLVGREVVGEKGNGGGVDAGDHRVGCFLTVGGDGVGEVGEDRARFREEGAEFFLDESGDEDPVGADLGGGGERYI